MDFIAIIPARYASTRFPGKPLVQIAGKLMIQRVYEQALKAFDVVVVATDDERIYHAVESFGGEVAMTSAEHSSGTDRCAEAVELFEKSMQKRFDVVVNVQGDEPFIKPEQLKALKGCFEYPDVDIASLVKKIDAPSEIYNPNLPKVVFDKNMKALYFSRSPIPYIRGFEQAEWFKRHTFYRHIGLYAYRKEVLFKLTKLEQSTLEKAESLEQNRWLENGYSVHLAITEFETIGIDTPEDLERANEWFKKQG